MLGALICEYWGVGVLIRGNWVSLYSRYGHALIFVTNLIYEKLENYPFSAYKGMSLYAGQYGMNEIVYCVQTDYYKIHLTIRTTSAQSRKIITTTIYI